MKKIKAKFLIKNIFAYIPDEVKKFELFKYNRKFQKLFEIDIYNYQKIFIQKHFMIDLSKFKISNLIKYFNSTYNNFSRIGDKKNLKKIIAETPWFNDFKKEKIITKNSMNYTKCIKLKYFDNLVKLNNRILSNLMIFNLQSNYSHSDSIFIKDVFPNLIKLKLNMGKSRNMIINISYNLLKHIQILSLTNTKIYIIDIDNTCKEIELLSLKSLKLARRIIFRNEETIICPNLEYIFVYSGILFFYKNTNINQKNKLIPYNLKELEIKNINILHKIPLKFPKLIYCNIIDIKRLIDNKKITEITIRKFDKGLITYKYANENNNRKYKKYFYSKNDKNGEDESYEEIITNLKNAKINNFLLGKTNQNYNYLQHIEIVLDKENIEDDVIKSKMNNFIENLKNFKFLRIFCLNEKTRGIISKNNLLNIINNLSTLKLIENIKIEVMNNFDLDKNEEKNIIDCFREIKINKTDKTILIELNNKNMKKKLNKNF